MNDDTTTKTEVTAAAAALAEVTEWDQRVTLRKEAVLALDKQKVEQSVEVHKLEQRLATLKGLDSDLVRQHARLQQIVQQQQAHLEGETSTMAAQQQGLRKTVQASHDNIRALRARCDDAAQRVETCKTELLALPEQHRAQMHELKKQLQQQEEKRAALEAEHQGIETEVQQRQARVDHVRQTLEQERAEHMEQLQSSGLHLARHTKALESTRQMLDQASTDLSGLTTRVQQWEDAAQARRDEVERLHAEVTAAQQHLEHAEKEHNDTLARIAEFRQRERAAKSQGLALQQQHEEYLSQRESLVARERELDERRKDEPTLPEGAWEELEALESDVQAAQLRNQGLLRDNTALTTRLADLDHDSATFQTKVQEMETRRKRAEIELQRAQLHKEQLQHEHRELSQWYEKKDVLRGSELDKLTQLEQQKTDILAAIETVKLQAQLQKGRNERLQQLCVTPSPPQGLQLPKPDAQQAQALFAQLQQTSSS